MFKVALNLSLKEIYFLSLQFSQPGIPLIADISTVTPTLKLFLALAFSTFSGGNAAAERFLKLTAINQNSVESSFIFFNRN